MKAPTMTTTAPTAVDSEGCQTGRLRRAEGWARGASPTAVLTVRTVLEGLADVDDGRADHDHEQRREHAEHHGDQHLHRGLLRLLLRQLTTLDAHLVGLGPEDPTDRHAEGVGLEDGEDEG